VVARDRRLKAVHEGAIEHLEPWIHLGRGKTHGRYARGNKGHMRK